ncbi:SpoIID/LytB domain-containing protein [Kitasatospora sp. KL5]|uniref:SpoIID/LytB domain-containing protein n=1 Tax=Kitasatospora sp. KL5 TaxID=3425125 RepID=UPI003D6E01D9
MSVIRGLRPTLIGVTAMATVCCVSAGTAVAAVLPSPSASPSKSITLSGTVKDARAERVSGEVIIPPASMPAVNGARIEVNGTLVGRTDRAGAFKFDYPDPTGKPVTITVTAPGFGAYQLAGVTPEHTGDSLTVQLTGKAQSGSDQAAPATDPLNRAAAATAQATAGSCGGYSSDSTPPSTIRVLQYSQHTSAGAPVAGTQIGVVSVPFQSYVQDVLANEWIPSWQPDALKAGAMAAKTYAWYQVNHWRGGSYGGTCYNVDDSINYQRYIPGSATAATNAAVAATWNTVMTRNGSVFQASYQATLTNNPSEACGSGLSRYPDTLSQWGSQNCALAGNSWQSILSRYYPGVSFSGASALGTVSFDAAGGHVGFVDTNGNVANDWATSTGWAGPALLGGQARADSPVVFSPSGDKVFFIDTNGNVANDWYANGSWQGPALIGGKARAGSSLVTDAAGYRVAFVDTDGNVANDWATSSGWQGPALLGGQARSDSPLAFDANSDHVFFIDTNGDVANDWMTSSGWQGPALIGGKARAGSGLATDAAGYRVAFVDTDGNVANDWATSSGWQGPALLGGQARSDSPLVFDANSDHLYFIDTNGDVANDWATSGGWQGPALIGGQARAGSGLSTTNAGNLVAFVDTNGFVANDWQTGSGWQGPALLGGTSR